MRRAFKEGLCIKYSSSLRFWRYSTYICFVSLDRESLYVSFFGWDSRLCWFIECLVGPEWCRTGSQSGMLNDLKVYQVEGANLDAEYYGNCDLRMMLSGRMTLHISWLYLTFTQLDSQIHSVLTLSSLTPKCFLQSNTDRAGSKPHFSPMLLSPLSFQSCGFKISAKCGSNFSSNN